MKTYRNLYEKLVSDENVRKSIKNGFKGKGYRKNVDYILSHMDESVLKYQRMAEHFYNAKHVPRLIYDGVRRKQRYIIVPSNDEQVIHHMIVNTLSPIFMKSMYEHSYGSIPGRGSHKAKKFIKKWLVNDIKNTKYCLKMDIRKFFDSIPHDKILDKLGRIIKDEKMMALIREIVNVQEVGIPLGFYTSQWFANFYLTELDHYIKEVLGARYYVRYMDDMVIFDGNKKKLHAMRKAIDIYLRENLGLQLKDNWQIFKIEYIDKDNHRHGRPLDFMGFKFYRGRVTLRRSIMLRMSRKARRMGTKAKHTIRDCRQFLSYVGWLSATDTYRFYENRIKPFVNIQKLKKRLSNYDTRTRKEMALCGD